MLRSDRGNAVPEIPAVVGRRVIARNAPHAHAIPAIRRRIHFEGRVVEIERIAQIAIQLERRRQFHDSIMLIA